jgi:Putative transmembrane protein (PGPGW)
MAFRKTWVTVLGWMLVALGVAALILPGPGLLLLLAGLVVLSQEYEWAERRVEPVKEKAFEVARSGVSTYPRIALSTVSALAVVAVGVFWCLDPDIPEIGPFGPDLPLGGWPTGSSIIASGLVALGLLAYSIKRFRGQPVGDRGGAGPGHSQ